MCHQRGEERAWRLILQEPHQGMFYERIKAVLFIQSGLLDEFQYCDSNIVFFSIIYYLVIALPTLR